MWPVHTWLPDAHVQAPTAGSVILAGVLLKMGGYGFLRFSLPMFPQASAHFMWLIFALSMIAMVYTSLVALVQKDMKKLIAYSSVAHMAIVTFGLFAFNRQGIEGAMMVMLGHGLVSAALFLCVGVVYDRLHTREIDRYGGIANNMPHYATVLPVLHHGVGRPAGPSNFVGRVPVADGHLRDVDLGGVRRDDRHHHSARPTCSTSIAASPSAPQKNADAAAMPDLEPARMADPRADRRGGAVDGRLSRELPRADARRCRRASSRASRRPRRRATPQLTAPHAHAGRRRRRGALRSWVTPHSFALSLPEIILSFGAIVLMLVAAWAGDKASRAISWIAVALLAVAAVVAARAGGLGRGRLSTASTSPIASPPSPSC